MKKDHENIVEIEQSEEKNSKQKDQDLNEKSIAIPKSVIKPTSPTIPKPKRKSEQENTKSEYFTKSVNEAKIVWKANIESATVIKWLEAKKANKNLTMAKFCETQGILRSMLCKWLSNFKDKDLILKAITIPISKGKFEDVDSKSTSKRNKFQCKLCDKDYDTKGDLKHHIQLVHDKKLQFECEFCNVKHSNKSSLQKHIAFRHNDKLKKLNKTNEKDEDLSEKSITIPKSLTENEQLIEIPEATESESLKEKSITIPKFPFSKKNLKGQLISE